MSWARQAANAGIGGLREWEAARGVMAEEVDVDLSRLSNIRLPERTIIKDSK